MKRIMMTCGHVANSTYSNKDKNIVDVPSCVICSCIEISKEEPDLTGRMARCSCLEIVPSDFNLAFFEFRGEDSQQAKESCKICGYYKVAHTTVKDYTYSKHPAANHEFTPHGAYEFDSYYCGHNGWD